MRDNELARSDDSQNFRDVATEHHPVDPPDELAWNEDSEDFRDGQFEPKVRLLPSFKALVGMAFLGVALAFIWQYSAGLLEAVAQWQPTSAQRTAEPNLNSQPLQDQLIGALRDVEGLKKAFADLAAAQQQISANIASLQVSQQELRQRAQPPPYWYSDFTHFLKPRTSATTNTRQDQKVGTHNNGAQPLSLSSASGR